MIDEYKNTEKPSERIIIFDTTLRDGEQASGFHMFPEEKLEIAKQLARLGVDVIEAGFAVSSPGDFEAIQKIASEVGTENGPIICSLARAVDGDIETAARALDKAKRKRIHTFIATSDIHIDGKFRKTREWVIEQATRAIKKAREYVEDVEFSCEDFGRTDKDYTVEIVCEAIKAGASTINLPDTVGWLTPSEEYEKLKYVIDNVRARGFDAVFSVHNHNDFGMATATTIEGLRAGARQAEVTINGIGERAGNTSLEEVVAVIKTRKLFQCNIDTKLIGETSRLVSNFTGIEPQPNKAIVGKNAFSHEAGIHQDGVKKNANTYETMDPKDYGVESIITFGPRSGRNALKAKYESLGIKLNDAEFQNAVRLFTSIADGLKESDDADIIRSVCGQEIEKYYQFDCFVPSVGKVYGGVLKLKVGEEIIEEYSEGNGQIDAAFKAIKKIIGENYELADFKVKSKGKGSDALGITQLKIKKLPSGNFCLRENSIGFSRPEKSIKDFSGSKSDTASSGALNPDLEISRDGWYVLGNGGSCDVVTSAIEAFVDGCNRMRYLEKYFARKKS